METQDTNELALKAEIQKKVLGNCISNLHTYFRSRNWELLANKFRTLGLVLPNDLVSCKICDNDMSSYYFYSQKKIIICANNVVDKEFTQVVTRQVVSAYDDARADIDPKNPSHIACTTVRGVNLSGECLSHKSFNFFNKYTRYISCVKEKATKEMMKNKNLKMTAEAADEEIHEVWDTCFNDYEPFSLEEHRKNNPANII